MVKRIIRVGASWCGPCKVFALTFKKASEMPEFKNIQFESVDIDEDEDMMVEKFGIRTVPTTVLLDKNDEPIYKIIGNVSLNDFVRVINTASGKGNEIEEEV